MKFVVEENVFNVLPDVCFGVVVANGISNGPTTPVIAEMFLKEQENLRARFGDVKPKDHPAITPYRDAFVKLGINPNKFMSSIEALTTRVYKGGNLPLINSIVDLCNVVSLKYLLPMGAHDIGRMEGDIRVGFSKEGDIFTPFGSTESESVEPGELVYADDREIRTRKWIWRQGNNAKIENDSSYIFFPIDGFKGVNDEQVRLASEELSNLVKEFFECETKLFFIDSININAEW